MSLKRPPRRKALVLNTTRSALQQPHAECVLDLGQICAHCWAGLILLRASLTAPGEPPSVVVALECRAFLSHFIVGGVRARQPREGVHRCAWAGHPFRLPNPQGDIGERVERARQLPVLPPTPLPCPRGRAGTLRVQVVDAREWRYRAVEAGLPGRRARYPNSRPLVSDSHDKGGLRQVLIKM